MVPPARSARRSSSRVPLVRSRLSLPYCTVAQGKTSKTSPRTRAQQLCLAQTTDPAVAVDLACSLGSDVAAVRTLRTELPAEWVVKAAATAPAATAVWAVRQCTDPQVLERVATLPALRRRVRGALAGNPAGPHDLTRPASKDPSLASRVHAHLREMTRAQIRQPLEAFELFAELDGTDDVGLIRALVNAYVRAGSNMMLLTLWNVKCVADPATLDPGPLALYRHGPDPIELSRSRVPGYYAMLASDVMGLLNRPGTPHRPFGPRELQALRASTHSFVTVPDRPHHEWLTPEGVEYCLDSPVWSSVLRLADLDAAQWDRVLCTVRPNPYALLRLLSTPADYPFVGRVLTELPPHPSGLKNDGSAITMPALDAALAARRPDWVIQLLDYASTPMVERLLVNPDLPDEAVAPVLHHLLSRLPAQETGSRRHTYYTRILAPPMSAARLTRIIAELPGVGALLESDLVGFHGAIATAVYDALAATGLDAESAADHLFSHPEASFATVLDLCRDLAALQSAPAPV